MNFRTLFSSNTPLRNSSSDTTNYQSTQTTNPYNNSNNDQSNRPNSSTFCTPNMHQVRPLNNYLLSSDFSSNSPSHQHNNEQQNNPYASHNIHPQSHNQQLLNTTDSLKNINTKNDKNAFMPPNMSLPETLHYASSAPSIKLCKHKNSYENMSPYNTSFAIINNAINAVSPVIGFEEEDEDEEISFLDNDIIQQTNTEPSSSASKSIYTNTPSVIPLMTAFRGISSLNNIIVKPCSEKFDIGVITLTLSHILNYLTLKLFYPFAGFIYPILGVTYFEYVLFISLSNVLTFMLFIIQPMFEYFPTNYVLFLLQLVIIVVQIFFIVFSNYSIIILTVCRMIFIFCLNSIWVQTNGAIRSFTINNIVVNSRRNLLLHSSWTFSTFFLCLLGYIWSELDSMKISFNVTASNSLMSFDILLFFLVAPTFIFSLLYLILIPSKKLRIKYYDESLTDVIKRTWSFIMNDINHILKIKYVNLLIFVNILGAINSMMILFIFGIWIQNLLNLNIIKVAKYTLIQAISEFFVMIVNLNKFKVINRKALSIISVVISIIFVVWMFGSTYLALNICPFDNNKYENKWFCEWLSIIYHKQHEKYMNKSILITCLFGIFFGHETFVTTVNSCIFRECRRNNTPNAAYPIWNIIGCGATFCGQIFVGILWVYCGQIYSILIILIVMFMLDLIALFTLFYAFRLHKKR